MHLKLVQLNVRSVFTGFDHLSNYLNCNDIGIPALSETWLNVGISSDVVSIKCYTLYRADCEGRGGGLASYVNEHLTKNCDLMHNPVLEVYHPDGFQPPFNLGFYKCKILYLRVDISLKLFGVKCVLVQRKYEVILCTCQQLIPSHYYRIIQYLT
nr:unnamed protein product [Callosobruchus analis]